MIKIENLSFGYRKGHDALFEANAEFGAGIHLLLGPNGAGKTTLFRLMAGLLRPQSGECIFGKEATVYHSPHAIKDIFMLTDEFRFPLNTVNDMARLHAPFYPNFSREFLDEALATFSMTGNERLNELSFGNRHKAQLAYLLALDTKVLMLDEPANGLDMNSKRTLATLINRAMELDENRCIIIATHTVQEMRNLFDSVTMLNQGNIVLNASVAKVTERLAFISDTKRHPDALCFENTFEGPNQIIPNTDGRETVIDYPLLFAAATGDSSDKLKLMLQ